MSSKRFGGITCARAVWRSLAMGALHAAMIPLRSDRAHGTRRGEWGSSGPPKHRRPASPTRGSEPPVSLERTEANPDNCKMDADDRGQQLHPARQGIRLAQGLDRRVLLAKEEPADAA